MPPHPREPKQTLMVSLPGQQGRIRQMILYVARRCEHAKYFGAIKLNKIIWKADFDSFAARRIPITGREYRRRYFGPALREMLPVHREMLREGIIRVDPHDFGDGIVEQRTIALVPRIVRPRNMASSASDERRSWSRQRGGPLRCSWR